MKTLVQAFANLPLDDASFGRKALVMAELYQKGAQILPGYAISSLVLRKFLTHNHLDVQIKKLLNHLDPHNQSQLSQISNQITKLILKAEIDPQLTEILGQISKNLKENSNAVEIILSVPEKLKPVYLWENMCLIEPLNSALNLGELIKQAWAYGFSQEALNLVSSDDYYNQANKVSVILKPALDSEITVNSFSRNPLNQNQAELYFEAVWGIWLPQFQPEIIPDTYIVNATNKQINKIKLQLQPHNYRLRSGLLTQLPVSKLMSKTQKLNHQLLSQLSQEILMLKRHYNTHLRVEYVYLRGKFLINNLTLLETVTPKDDRLPAKVSSWPSSKPLVTGISAFPGKASGRILYLKSAKDYQQIKPHHIVVMRRPLLSAANKLKQAAAILSAQSGQVSESAIIGREFRIPTIIGIKNIFTSLAQNQIVTLDAKQGLVYHGKLNLDDLKPKPQTLKQKVGVEIQSAEILPALTQLQISGSVLVDADQIYLQKLATHPSLIEKATFQTAIKNSLGLINHNFYSNSLIYRAHRLTHRDFLKLKQGKKGERQLGVTASAPVGLKRYLLDYTTFVREVEALSDYMIDHPDIDLAYAIPNITDVVDYEAVLGVITRHLPNVSHFIYLDSLQTVFVLEDLFKRGVSGLILDLGAFLQSYFETEPSKLNLGEIVAPNDPTGSFKALTIIVNTAKRFKAPTMLSLGTINLNANALEQFLELGFDQVITLPERYNQFETQ